MIGVWIIFPSFSFKPTCVQPACRSFPEQSVPLAIAGDTDHYDLTVEKALRAQNTITLWEEFPRPPRMCEWGNPFFFSFNSLVERQKKVFFLLEAIKD